MLTLTGYDQPFTFKFHFGGFSLSAGENRGATVESRVGIGVAHFPPRQIRPVAFIRRLSGMIASRCVSQTAKLTRERDPSVAVAFAP